MKRKRGDSSSHRPKTPARDRKTPQKNIVSEVVESPRYIPGSPLRHVSDESDSFCLEEELEEAQAYPFNVKKCETALQFYNKKHRTNYELVEFVGTNQFMCIGFFDHCNFTAKDISESEPKLFFAETKSVYRHATKITNIIVRTCRILDGVEQVKGCQHCNYYYDNSKLVVHPSGFKSRIYERNYKRIDSLRQRQPKMNKGDFSSHWPKDPTPDRKTARNDTFEEVESPRYIPPSPIPSSLRRVSDEPNSPYLEEILEAKAYPFKIKNCETALQFYNKKHLQRTNYELVEFVGANEIMCDDFFEHCNFTAKDISELEPELFFAEIKFVYRQATKVEDTIVRSCRLLDGVEQVKGCQFCKQYYDYSKLVIHPSGFKPRIYEHNCKRLDSLRPRPPK